LSIVVNGNWQILSVSVDYHPVFLDRFEILLSLSFSGQKTASAAYIFKFQFDIFWKISIIYEDNDNNLIIIYVDHWKWNFLKFLFL